MDAPGPPTLARRTVLVSALATAAVAAVATNPVAALVAPAPRAVARGLRRRDWRGLVGRQVTVSGPSGSSRMKVTGVTDIAGARPGHDRCFAVLLQASRPASTSGGIRTVTRPGHPGLDLFLAPVGIPSRITTYQIIVNNPT